MPESTEPKSTVGFSVQNDGEMIGIHFDLPMCAIAVGWPTDQAATLAKEFGPALEKVVAQARRQKSGLTIAPAESLNVLKGHNN